MANDSEIEMAIEKLTQYSHTELSTLTSRFSTKLGGGAFGQVYKGQLRNGVEVAVKVLDDNEFIVKQFMAEVKTLGLVHHKNLVRLYGYCSEPDKKALVYEYMENGSLERKLHHTNPSIKWEKLYDIAIGIAHGLSYLHEHCQQRIIHYDIKPENILLDSRFSPKLGDFGLAALYDREKAYVTLSGMRGTRGYAAPEILNESEKVTRKCDVYSYGMIMFDLLGRRRHRENSSFLVQVWEKFERGQLDQIMDDCGIKEKDRETAKRIPMIGFWCLQIESEKRPSMTTVVQYLETGQGMSIPPYPFSYLNSSYSTQRKPAYLVPAYDGHAPTQSRQVQFPSQDDKKTGTNKEMFKPEEKRYTNEFMLPASDLEFTHGDNKNKWHWLSMRENYGGSDVDVTVAELLVVYWLKVKGNLDTSNLSGNTKYEIVFVVMLKNRHAEGWEAPVLLRLKLPNGDAIERKERLQDRPRGQWFEIRVGEFFTSPDEMGNVRFALSEKNDEIKKSGLVIKRVVFRPKY